MNFAEIADRTTNWLNGWPAWALASGLALLIVVGGLTLHRLGGKAIHTRLLGDISFVHRLFLRTRNVFRFALMIFAIAVVLPLLPLPSTVEDTLHRIFIAAFVVLVGWLVLVVHGFVIERYAERFNLAAADNLHARQAVTQLRILERAVDFVIILITLGFALMSFDSVRQFGISLFASAGIAGLVAGLAARPVLSNLIAGIQLAFTQPIRIDDVVIVENEWGRVEDLTATFVVIRIWDLRRLIVPLSYFLEKPFQNWTREGSSLLGTVFLYVDYSIPVERVRAKLKEIVGQSKLWDGKVVALEVTDAKDTAVELRALVSAADSSAAWSLRCEVREKLIAFIQREFPDSLPKRRGELVVAGTESMAIEAKANRS